MPRETLAEKQEKVLEKIFEHLLKSGRKDLVDAYHDITKEYSRESYPKARHAWKCIKCRKTIEKGENIFVEQQLTKIFLFLDVFA